MPSDFDTPFVIKLFDREWTRPYTETDLTTLNRWLQQWTCPPPRLGSYVRQERDRVPPPEPKLPQKLTAAQQEEAEQLGRLRILVWRRRRDAWMAEHKRRWKGVPYVAPVSWGGGGPQCGHPGPPDVDGFGSWGRVVRIVEDSR